jgi:natural product precursor
MRSFSVIPCRSRRWLGRTHQTKGSDAMKKEMQPRKLKKLELNRETLRNLDNQELTLVVGGATIICTERCTGVSCYC